MLHTVLGHCDLDLKVSKGAKIRNRYNQVPHLTQDTNGKVTNSQLDTTASKLDKMISPSYHHIFLWQQYQILRGCIRIIEIEAYRFLSTVTFTSGLNCIKIVYQAYFLY